MKSVAIPFLAALTTIVACTPSSESNDAATNDSAVSNPAPAEPTQATTSSSTNTIIPGLKAGDVTAMFGGKGFNCKNLSSGEITAWTCDVSETTHGYVVQFFGAAQDSIDEVKLQSMTFSGDPKAVATSFLVNGASIPYEGADPAAAEAWIKSNVGTDAETRIGGVLFRLSVSGDIITLYLKP